MKTLADEMQSLAAAVKAMPKRCPPPAKGHTPAMQIAQGRETKRKAQELAAEGFKPGVIARRLGITPGHVWKLLRDA